MQERVHLYGGRAYFGNTLPSGLLSGGSKFPPTPILRRCTMRTVRRFIHSSALLGAVWVSFALVGCSDSSLAPTQPNLSEQDPENPGSGLVDVFWDEKDGLWGYMDVAEEHDVSGSFPQWDGRDPVVAGLPAGAAWSCPVTAQSVMVLATNNRGTFIIAGVFQREFEYGVMRNGFPTARYRVPPTQHYNTSGDYYLYGGSVDVECQGGYLNLGIVKYWVGNLDPYAYYGSSGPSNRRERTGSNGWAFQNASYQNGSTGGGSGAENWQSVLQRYIDTGQCTEGWTIIVDDVKRC